MNYILIASCMMALGLFGFMRPKWSLIGPSLIDSFIIGLCLFAIGSILVWVEGLPNSEAVMRIGVSTAMFGALGASLWSFFFTSGIARLNFFSDARCLYVDPVDQFIISSGLVLSSLVSTIMLIAVFSHEHIRSLLLEGVLGDSGKLNDARVIISSGAEGYFAPGYVKQFRDIIVPILCVTTILSNGTYTRRGLSAVALMITFLAIIVSGQRLVIIQCILCLGAAFLINRNFSSLRATTGLAAVGLLLVLFGALGTMTKLMNRFEVPMTAPLSEQQRMELRRGFITELSGQKADLVREISTASEWLKVVQSSGQQAEVDLAKKELADAEAAAMRLEQVIERVKNGDQMAPEETKSVLDSATVPTAILMPLALAYRVMMAVPRENTVYYSHWAVQQHAPGSGWLTDLGSIRFGTQSQLSNELAGTNYKPGSMGNSPLGLATDIFYNWGWLGVIIVPALYALGLLWLDIALTASRSALTFAAKVFAFFAIPVMYSPFMFVLYGGFVAIGILCYVWLRKKGAFSLLEERLKAP